jgi:hypothetical protein
MPFLRLIEAGPANHAVGPVAAFSSAMIGPGS